VALSMTDSTQNCTQQVIPWGISSALLGISFNSQAKEYWSDPSSFHIMNWNTEYDDALLADKFGHLTFSYVSAKTLSGLFESGGYNKREATWLGSGIALFHQTIVEIKDGYSEGAPYLGFSHGDALANIIGAGLPVLQEYYPELNFMHLKFSFNPSESFKQLGGNSIMNDYESTYHWLSFNIAGMIGKNRLGPWANYVNIALGHSVKGIDRYGSGNHEMYLSLDFNAEALPFEDGIGLTLKRLLNTLKLPMPCIKIYPHIVWYGIRI
jgi:hypothetical protein